MSALDELQKFCDRLEEACDGRVVVRWIDEQRPVHEDDEVAIREVTEATLKTAIDGEIVTRTFEHIPYAELKSTLAPYDFEVLYRSDNLTRWSG